MKKSLILLLLSATLLIPACSADPADELDPQPNHEDQPLNNAAVPEIEIIEPDGTPGLYPHLEIEIKTATRYGGFMAGGYIHLSVLVRNTGDKTIKYLSASGSFVTSRTITTKLDGIQPLFNCELYGDENQFIEEWELGPDGEVYISVVGRAIKPHPQFYNYMHELYTTHDRYSLEDWSTIADMEWREMQVLYPDLEEADLGLYEGTMRFYYELSARDSGASEATAGYQETPFSVIIIEE